MKATIEVTQEDIAGGDPHNPCENAIAIAAKRVLGGFPLVARKRMVVLRQYTQVTIHLPSEAQQFMDDLLAGNPVAPLSFPVSVPFGECFHA